MKGKTLMKNIKIVLSMMAALTLVISSVYKSNAGWIDDWVSQKVYSGPNYYQGQQRGYFSGGSFSARWPVKKDYLLTVQPPRIKAGCGGIDIFTGGISFMNFNYLVQKLERILQSAPAAAFDLALNVLCEPCSKAIKSMEAIADQLNHMSLDECKASKAVAAYSLDKTGVSDLFSDTNVYESGGELSDWYSDYEVTGGLSDSYQSVKQSITASGGTSVDNASPDDLVSGCPREVTALFYSVQGSMLANLNQQIGLNESQDFIELLRGFVGDIELKSGGPRGVMVSSVPPCSSNNQKTVDNLVNGDVEKRSLDTDTCMPVADANANLTLYIKNMILGIAGKIQSRQPLTAEQIAFIQANPLSVLSTIKGAIRANNVDVIAANLAEPTAKAYAYRLMDDMYQRIWFMTQRAQLVASRAQAANGAAAETCKYEVLKPQIDKMAAFGAAINETRQHLKESYITAIQEINSVYALVSRFEKVDEIMDRDLSRRFGSSTAQRAMNR